MKKIAFIIVTVMVTRLTAFPVDLQVPDLSNGIMNQYSYNFVNASMTARGNTGISTNGKIGSGIYNPASYYSEQDHFVVELFIKNSVEDFTKKYYENDDELYLNKNRYKQTRPISFIGIGLAPIYGDWNLGISYSLNRSIKFKSPIFPYTAKYNEKQYILTINKPFGNFVIGLNNIFLRQDYDDYWNTEFNEKVTFSENILRLQLGALYDMEKVQFGLTYTPKNEKTIGRQNFRIDVVYPSKLSAGISFVPYQSLRTLLDLEYTRYSETSKELSNQLIWKIGIENIHESVILKVGLIYFPDVFTGNYILHGDGEDLKYGLFDDKDLLIATAGAHFLSPKK